MLLNARQIFEEEHTDSTLLLLAIEDITQRRDAEREKDELLRQKEMLLQEMQHRVANSLQIVASSCSRRELCSLRKRGSTCGTPTSG